VGQTLVAQEHDTRLVPQGFGMHTSGMVSMGPPMWCMHTKPGVHCVVPHAGVDWHIALWSDHDPFSHVAVVSAPSTGH
jgi:hypothetical protein